MLESGVIHIPMTLEFGKYGLKFILWDEQPQARRLRGRLLLLWQVQVPGFWEEQRGRGLGLHLLRKPGRPAVEGGVDEWHLWRDAGQ